MKKFLSFCFAALIIITSGVATAQQDDCTKKFSWLKGTWTMEDHGNKIVEQWTDAGSSLKCKSYDVKGKDSVLIENASISCIGGKNVFTNYPQQSGQPPVHFVLVSEENNTFVFENKEHDFPQRVVYKKISEKECLAWIEGSHEGKQNKIEFKYTKAE